MTSTPTGRLDEAFLEGAEDLEELLAETRLRRLTAQLRMPRFGAPDVLLWGGLALFLVFVATVSPGEPPPETPAAVALETETTPAPEPKAASAGEPQLLDPNAEASASTAAEPAPSTNDEVAAGAIASDTIVRADSTRAGPRIARASAEDSRRARKMPRRRRRGARRGR